MKNLYKRQPIGRKLLSEFNPHSFLLFDETKKNKVLQKMLRQINLYYSLCDQTPPISYLVFVLRENVKKEEVIQGIKYLAHYEWFTIVQTKKTFTYHITLKFKKAFYHSIEGDGENYGS